MKLGWSRTNEKAQYFSPLQVGRLQSEIRTAPEATTLAQQTSSPSRSNSPGCRDTPPYRDRHTPLAVNTVPGSYLNTSLPTRLLGQRFADRVLDKLRDSELLLDRCDLRLPVHIDVEHK